VGEWVGVMIELTINWLAYLVAHSAKPPYSATVRFSSVQFSTAYIVAPEVQPAALDLWQEY
jgi:hypothetical protein